MTLTEILEKFENTMSTKLAVAAISGTGHAYYAFMKENKAFLTQAITEAFEAVRPNENRDHEWADDIGNSEQIHYENGWNNCRIQLDENIKKFLENNPVNL